MDILASAFFAGFSLFVALNLASFCTWFERKGSALIQNRVGANRAGRYLSADILATKEGMKAPYGLHRIASILLIPAIPVIKLFGFLGIINTLFCDSLKGVLKEDFVPDGTSQFIHCLGPFLAVFPVLLSFAVLPFAPEFSLNGFLVRPQAAPLDVGVLFVLAMGSVSVYGVAIAGWGGRNKFSLLGGLRAAAQMISYELAMGVVFVTMILTHGSMDFYRIVEAQEATTWGIFYQPLGFVILFIVGLAETKRGPFDLPESESEIVAGYFTEYSGMKFLVFWLGEFAEIALFSFVIALLFLGGWSIPFISLEKGLWWTSLLYHGALMTKVILLCMFQIVVRWSLPRFRYDQLMSLGWKGLLPLSLLNLAVTACFLV